MRYSAPNMKLKEKLLRTTSYSPWASIG